MFVIEANPRASRTVPFVAKATGVPLAKVAARVMVGATLAELRDEGLLREPGRRRPRERQGGGAALRPVPRRRHRARARRCARPARSWASTAPSAWPSPRARSRPATRCPPRGTVFLSLADRGQGRRRRGGRAGSSTLGLRHRGHVRHGRPPARPPASPVAGRWPRLGDDDGTGADAVELIASRQGAAGGQHPPGPRPARRRRPHPARRPTSATSPCLTTVAAGPGRGRRHRRLGPPPAAGAQPAGVPRGGEQRPAAARDEASRRRAWST